MFVEALIGATPHPLLRHDFVVRKLTSWNCSAPNQVRAYVTAEGQVTRRQMNTFGDPGLPLPTKIFTSLQHMTTACW